MSYYEHKINAERSLGKALELSGHSLMARFISDCNILYTLLLLKSVWAVSDLSFSLCLYICDFLLIRKKWSNWGLVTGYQISQNKLKYKGHWQWDTHIKTASFHRSVSWVFTLLLTQICVDCQKVVMLWVPLWPVWLFSIPFLGQGSQDKLIA